MQLPLHLNMHSSDYFNTARLAHKTYIVSTETVIYNFFSKKEKYSKRKKAKRLMHHNNYVQISCAIPSLLL